MPEGWQREVRRLHDSEVVADGIAWRSKTTLSEALAPRLNAVHFNADEIRANINKDLGFSEVDRIEQSVRMGWLCDQHLARPSSPRGILRANARTQDLEKAKALIESWGIVGIVEDYKRSVERFQAFYEADFPELRFVDVRANRTSERDAGVEEQTRAIRKELGAPLFRRLARAIRLDLALYDWAVLQFSPPAVQEPADPQVPRESSSH